MDWIAGVQGKRFADAAIVFENRHIYRRYLLLGKYAAGKYETYKTTISLSYGADAGYFCAAAEALLH